MASHKAHWNFLTLGYIRGVGQTWVPQQQQYRPQYQTMTKICALEGLYIDVYTEFGPQTFHQRRGTETLDTPCLPP